MGEGAASTIRADAPIGPPDERSSSDSGFEMTFAGIPVPEASDGFDPLVFHKRHFDDDQYRVLFKNDPFGVDETQLWKTADFSSWTQVSASIAGDADQFEDHIVLPDGTFVLYQSPTPDGGTSVWTGTELTDLTKQGTPIPEPDGGVFYDRDTGTIHIYTEDQDHTTGPGADKLSHWTTPDDDLLDATKRRDAVDVREKPWHTGDPDIIEIEGTYYMFTDNTTNHPNYRIATLRSDNLYDWSIIQENSTPQRSGGDLTVTRHDGAFVGFTEYDNYADDGTPGVGRWEVSFRGDEAEPGTQVALEGGGEDGRDRSFDATPGESGQPVGMLRLHPDSAGAVLTGVTIQGDAMGASGVQRVGLVGSPDSTFDPSEDTWLATQTVDGDRFPSDVTFSGLDDSLGTSGRYLFLTVSLSDGASGAVRASVEHQGDITFANAQIGSVNGEPQGTFNALPLSRDPSALPVELVALEAERVRRGNGRGAVQLRWKTAAETENAGFAVQRRLVDDAGGDGRSAADASDWEEIGFVESKARGGTSTTTNRYRFEDADLPFAADRIEYRLRQVDLEGDSELSAPVVVEQRRGQLRLVTTYPNPVRDRVTIRFVVPERQEATLRLYDTLGRRVRTVYADESTGRQQQTIDLSGLSSGTYFLRLRAGGDVRTQRMTVVR